MDHVLNETNQEAPVEAEKNPASIPWWMVIASGTATLIACGGWLKGIQRYLGFGDIDPKPVVAGFTGLAFVYLISALLDRRENLVRTKSAGVRWLLVHMAFCAGLISFGSWWFSSPLNPNRIPVAMVFGLSGIWIAMFGAGWVYRHQIPAWNAIALLSIAPVFFFANAVRSQGIDGVGRPMTGFTWQKKRIVIKELSLEDDSSKLENRVVDEAWRGESWPQYMGRNRDGVGSPMFDPSNISEKYMALQWEVPVGPSWSSCVVDEDLIYTQEVRDGHEHAIALNMKDGARRWSSKLSTMYQSALGGDGSRATPSIAGSYLVALSADGTLVCMDRFSGKEHWRHQILDEAESERLYHGACGSPLCIEDKVYVFPGSEKGKAILAYSLVSGELAHQGGDQRASYSSLSSIVLHGQPMILACGGEKTIAYSLDLRRIFFSHPFSNSDKTICSQPLVIDPEQGIFLLSAGYGVGSQCVQASPGESPNVAWKVKELWSNRKNLKTKFCSAVAHNGLLFGLNEGVLECVRAADGTRVWKDGRYGHGQLILCGSLLVLQCEDGSLAVVDAAEEFSERLLSAQLNGKTWNHPTWSRPFLLLRNDTKLRCLRIN